MVSAISLTTPFDLCHDEYIEYKHHNMTPTELISYIVAIAKSNTGSVYVPEAYRPLHKQTAAALTAQGINPSVVRYTGQ